MLLELGVPPFMLFSSLTAIIGQRLVRRLCQECIEDYNPPEELSKHIQQVTDSSNPRLFRSRGCPACGHTGYNNRTGLFEILIPTTELRDAIFSKAPLHKLKEAAGKDNHRSFLEDGIIKASEGLTSYEEVVRAI
jgi:type IV pilus assembly protein PilB